MDHKNPELVVGKKYKLINSNCAYSQHLIGQEFIVNEFKGLDAYTDKQFLDKGQWRVSPYLDLYSLVEEKSFTPADRWDILKSDSEQTTESKNNYILLDSENVTAFDCDDTLVMWDAKVNDVYVTCPYTNRQEALARHEVHIQELKKNKAKGNKTIVWSAGGVKWAEAVVKALGIEEYVDLVMAKPNKFFDDLPAERVLANRVYIPFKEKDE